MPLGTHAGWNPRSAAIGNPEYLARWDGPFFMFPGTEAERVARGDPRPSIEARDKHKQQYVNEVAKAARGLVKDRLLLQEDAVAIVSRAERLVWPPAPIERPPFWALEP